MKSFIALFLAWEAAPNLCCAFTATRSANTPLTRLAYEKENLHDLLFEEWSQVHGPRFQREEVTSTTAAGAAVVAVVDESLALRFPNVPTVVESSSTSSEPGPAFAGSFRGLTGPSKAGLVLAGLIAASMAATSPEFDLSQAGSAAEMLQAGALVLGRILQDVQTLATSSLVKLPDFDTQALQTTLTGMESQLSTMQVYLMDQSQEFAHASSDSAISALNALQVSWADMMTNLYQLVATLMAQLDTVKDSASNDWAEMMTRLSAMQSNWMHDIEGVNEVMTAKMECSLQEMQTSWADMTTRLSAMQADWMQTFQAANQGVMANLNTAMDSATVSLQSEWSEASSRLSQAQTELAQDIEQANQGVMTSLNAAKDSATVSIQGMQSDFTVMSNRYSEWQNEVTMRQGMALGAKVEASRSFASTMADSMKMTLSSISDYAAEVKTGWTQEVSEGYQGFMEGASSILTRVFVF